MPQRQVTEEEKEIMYDLYAEKVSFREIGRCMGYSRTTIARYIHAAELGLQTIGEYENYRSQKKGAASLYALQKARIKRKGYKSVSAYYDHLARQQGFRSKSALESIRNRQRQASLENRILSELIRDRLQELGLDQDWLAARLGVTQSCISLYALGKIKPKAERQERLFTALGIPYKNIAEYMNTEC